MEALSRESKLVDDISDLTSGKDGFVNSEHESEPCSKFDKADEEIGLRTMRPSCRMRVNTQNSAAHECP